MSPSRASGAGFDEGEYSFNLITDDITSSSEHLCHSLGYRWHALRRIIVPSQAQSVNVACDMRPTFCKTVPGAALHVD